MVKIGDVFQGRKVIALGKDYRGRRVLKLQCLKCNKIIIRETRDAKEHGCGRCHLEAQRRFVSRLIHRPDN